MLKKLKKIISCIFVFLAYRICLSVPKLRAKLKRNRVRSQPKTTRSIYSQVASFLPGKDNLMLIKIIEESVKFIGS